MGAIAPELSLRGVIIDAGISQLLKSRVETRQECFVGGVELQSGGSPIGGLE